MDKQERWKIMSVSGESMLERRIVRMCRHRMRISGGIADRFEPAGVNPSLGNRNNAIQFPNSFSISFIPINLDQDVGIVRDCG
jgi:hypothetical protein